MSEQIPIEDSVALPAPVRGNAPPPDPYETFDRVIRQQVQIATNAVAPVGDRELQQIVHQAAQWLDHARGQVEKAATLAEVDSKNLRIPAEDREKLITQSHTTAADQVQEAARNARQNIDALAEKLENRILPDAPSREDSAMLREELMLRTRDLSPQEVALQLTRLAGGADRRLAGLLVNSSFTSALLSQLGERDQKAALQSIRKAAVAGTAMYGSDSERVAAQALTTATAALQSASVARTQWTRFRLEEIQSIATRSKVARNSAFDRAQAR